MCKYEMDLTSIVENTEQTRFCPQTDGRKDGQGETSIPPFNFVEARGYNKKPFSQEDWFQNVGCKMSAILFGAE